MKEKMVINEKSNSSSSLGTFLPPPSHGHPPPLGGVDREGRSYSHITLLYEVRAPDKLPTLFYITILFLSGPPT